MPSINRSISLSLFEEYCRKFDIDGKEIEATVSDVKLMLTIASTEQSQAKGYSDHDSSPSDNKGMLFVYDRPMPLAFWMKRVKFPLDIIFFDDNMEYINHETMDPDDDLPDEKLTQYRSLIPARYAVELPAGWCEKNMKPECKLSF